ncbi:MAG: hypothetical protein GX808_10035 [Syntrophomonadaceae bacterium]|jgi:hypothetical protein|nr:hypothetical protein [Syntrophomonadaceae bacterium]
MIEEKYIQAAMQESWYQRKAGTSSSFYQKAGCRILPNRLSITRDKLSNVRKNGRNLIHPVIGQLVGQFTKNEESPLKAHFPFIIRTQIWHIPEYPLFIGYGSIGISNEGGKIDRGSDTEDLIILEAEAPDWERIRIFYFPAMIKKLEEVMTHLSNKFTKKIY